MDSINTPTQEQVTLATQAVTDHSVDPINDEIWVCRECRITFPVKHGSQSEYRKMDEHVARAVLDAILNHTPIEKEV